MQSRRKVDYEWTVEHVDENGDIQDVYFWEENELEQAKAFLRAADDGHRIGLKRAVVTTFCAGANWRNDSTTDEQSRDYAYPDATGFLPLECVFGAPVPARFRKLDLTA